MDKMMMKPYQNLFKKALKKGRKKETMGKEQSPGKQTTQKKWATRREGNH
jgi:hypothetical protein